MQFIETSRLPRDDVDARLIHFEDIRGQRYTEIFLIDVDAGTGDLLGSIYTTIGRNTAGGSGDTSPQHLLDQVDVDDLKREYGVPAAYKNGPRLWTLDWIDVMVGAERDFSGLKARWVMWIDLPKDMGQEGQIAYRPMTGNRDTRFGIDTGSPAFMLDDPDGNSWVMKSAGLIVDPHQTYDSLRRLGDRLHPPSGWRYRVATLDRPLVLTPDNGTARITQDELGNTYDRVGGPFSNFTP